MIRFLGIILLSVLFISCGDREEISPFEEGFLAFSSSSKSLPFGKFKLTNLEDNKTVPYQVIIEIKNEKDKDGYYIINGQAPVNFYFANFWSDFEEKEIKIQTIGSTKIGGSPAALQFESEYLNRLASATHYLVNSKDNKLILFLPDEKQLIYEVYTNE